MRAGGRAAAHTYHCSSHADLPTHQNGQSRASLVPLSVCAGPPLLASKTNALPVTQAPQPTRSTPTTRRATAASTRAWRGITSSVRWRRATRACGRPTRSSRRRRRRRRGRTPTATAMGLSVRRSATTTRTGTPRPGRIWRCFRVLMQGIHAAFGSHKHVRDAAHAPQPTRWSCRPAVADSRNSSVRATRLHWGLRPAEK